MFKNVTLIKSSQRLLYEFFEYLFSQAWYSFGIIVNKGFLPKGGLKMGKGFGISLILVTIVLFFHGLSFGDGIEKGILPTNSSPKLIYSQWVLSQKGDLPSSSFEKTGSINTLYGGRPINAIRDPQFSVKPEVINIMQSPHTTDFQRRESSYFENGPLMKEKSSYHLLGIHLTGNDPDSSLNFIPSLSVANYGENTQFSTLERFRETDIFKSLAIFLELKLNF